jgi:hypothetical protein
VQLPSLYTPVARPCRGEGRNRTRIYGTRLLRCGISSARASNVGGTVRPSAFTQVFVVRIAHISQRLERAMNGLMHRSKINLIRSPRRRARARGGTVRPSAFTQVFVARMTGRSATFSHLSIRPT